MSDNKQSCDLCGLDIQVTGFSLLTTDGNKDFCCEGCQGIYQMLNEDKIMLEAES